MAGLQDLGRPPFQWKSRELQNPPVFLGASKPYVPFAKPNLEDIALWWINDRVEKTYIKVPEKDIPWNSITYTLFEDETGKPYGYKVTFDGSSDQALYLHPCNPLRWEPHWMRGSIEAFPDYTSPNSDESFTLQVYIGKLDSVLIIDVEGRCVRPAFKNMYKAYELYTGILKGFHDALRSSAPNHPAEQQLHHWATIRDQVHYRMKTDKSETGVMVQYRRVEVTADSDYPIHGILEQTFVRFPNMPEVLKWKAKLGDGELPANYLFLKGERTHYELFTCDSDKESEVFYLYNKTVSEWYRLYDHKKSTVSHVRAEISEMSIFPSTKDMQWDSVRTNFDVSLNPVQLFVCTDENRTLRERIIVKPTLRNQSSLPNDDLGKSTLPRELFLNRIVRQFDESHIKYFARSLHDSFHHSTATHYLYFEYEKHGSLSGLMKRHERNKEPNYGAHFPEIFIWSILWDVVNACHNLRYNRGTWDGQQGFVHHDIKPPNILLNSEDGEDPPAYPRGKLSDLEHYLRLGKENIVNMIGTQNFFAPEQFPPYPNSPLSTDVWQIGCLIWSLMRNQRYGMTALNPEGYHCYNSDYRGHRLLNFDVEKSRLENDRALGYDDLYSYKLTRLVNQCLDTDQRKRPSLHVLRNLVKHGRKQYDKHNGNLVKKRMSEVPEWYRVNYANEEFQTGVQFHGRKQRKKYGRSNKSGPDPYTQGEQDQFMHWLDNDEVQASLDRDAAPDNREMPQTGSEQNSTLLKTVGKYPNSEMLNARLHEDYDTTGSENLEDSEGSENGCSGDYEDSMESEDSDGYEPGMQT